VSIPGVTISYYPITGTTENELISAVLSGGPANCQMADAAACFSDSFKWSYQGVTDAGTSVCSVTKVDFQATYSMIFPEWVGPAHVPPTLATWWRKVMDHFVWHESQHLAIAKSYAVKLQAAIAGGPCDQSGQKALTDPLEAQLQAAQAAFDVQDQSWTWPAL
jgi:predicted secreted Zn-dependent protease